MKKLVEVHVLQNFAPSNLNRDDTGAPKDALFGGSRRARISSQCQKRAVRMMFDGGSAFDKSDLAVRSLLFRDHLAGILVDKGWRDDEAKVKAEAALAMVGLAVKDNGKTEYLLFLGRKEMRAFADFIDKNRDSISAPAEEPVNNDAGKRKTGKSGKKQANSELRKALEKILDGGKAADVALFGRMLADMPVGNQDAACQVAHAISTHAVEREFDYYTAIDDLKPDDTAGAGMMGTIDFNSACFYRYACLDADLLKRNLQGDRQLADKSIRAFLDAFVRSEPSGKQNSFAAHNPPEFVIVRTALDAAPMNLANAFETPVGARKDESLTRISAKKLMEKAAALREIYETSGDSFVLNGCAAEASKAPGAVFPSWPGLLDKVMAVVEGW